MKPRIKIIGGGLAGSEAAYQCLLRGFPVSLIEMRPHKMTPAHTSAHLAELVCSNSLRSNSLTNAVGLLKEEMRLANSIVMQAADACALPAGSALAVDRDRFSSFIEEKLNAFENFERIDGEVETLALDEWTIVATGPLTSDALSKEIASLTGQEAFHFFDAIAPIVTKESINFDIAYYKSRYDKGDSSDYINCPMDKEQFDRFYDELILAQTVELKEFELNVFEGCMPFEVMAKRGRKTLLFGPMKPVGLEKDGVRPYAVVQLRQDNAAASLYNLVGFQTHLTWGEQKRILRLIPGLENCEIMRYGVMHRNAYINSPTFLNPTYQSKVSKKLFFAGQITGVEGYVESAASGLLAAMNICNASTEKEVPVLSAQTMMGAMAHYITHASPKHFQPMNANFGILEGNTKDKEQVSRNALALFEEALHHYE